MVVISKAPLCMGFPRQEYRSGLSFLSPGDLPDPRIEPVSPALTGGPITTEPLEKPFQTVVEVGKFLSLFVLHFSHLKKAMIPFPQS